MVLPFVETTRHLRDVVFFPQLDAFLADSFEHAIRDLNPILREFAENMRLV